MNVVVITGASSGLGAEFARQLDKLNENSPKRLNPVLKDGPIITKDTCFYLVARRRERLEALEKSLEHPCKLFSMDLSDFDDAPLINELNADNAKISVLINAAGLGYYGTVEGISDKQLSSMLNVNVTALTLLTNHLLSYMRNNSWLVEIASSAAFLPQPGFSVYAASKAYVYSLSRALRRELKDRHIHVTALCPGPVATEFFDVALNESQKVPFYKKLFLAKKEPVVKKCLRDVRKNKCTSVYGPVMKLIQLGSKILPWKLILFFY